MLDGKEIAQLESVARDIRIDTIKCISSFGSGHIGGAMSVVETLVYLYWKAMKIKPEDPSWAERDRLVLSKGHAGPALYSVLANLGYFPKEWLETLNKGGTNLPSHADMLKTPGIDFTAGSLGQGISAAVGIAAAQRLKGYDAFTYAIVGDGESQEGEVWEAGMAAAAWGLDNFIAFTDLNGQQLDDYSDNVIPMHNMKERWAAFGFDAYEVDGHDFAQIDEAVSRAQTVKGKPHMIILKTVKSRGYAPGEGIKANHSMPISAEARDEAIAKLMEVEA